MKSLGFAHTGIMVGSLTISGDQPVIEYKASTLCLGLGSGALVDMLTRTGALALSANLHDT